MIIVPINVDLVSGGNAPYTFTFTSSDDNITFSNVAGTAALIGGVYTAITDVIYPDQTYFGATISCTFVDTNGCSKTLTPLVVSNPCTMQSTISTNGEFVFVANTTGGSGSYTYEWIYDTDLFEPNNDTDLTDNILSLKLKEISSPPVTSNIQVLIKDSNGCTLTKNYVYSFCYPTIAHSRITLSCRSRVTGCSLLNIKSGIAGLDLKEFVTTCTNQTIDWNTLSFSVPVNFCVEHIGNGIVNMASSNNFGITVVLNYTVSTTSGLQSSGGITVNVPICAERITFSGVPTTIQLVDGDIVGTEKSIVVEQRVSETPNWSTFTFTNTPTWGTVTLNGNREIVYEITDIATTPTIPDVIKWSMQDYSGNQINITDTVLRDIIAVPTTTLDTICNSCGESTDAIDLTANDTGDIDKTTVEIVETDPEIVITKDSNNDFIFTSLPGASFANQCKYRVANTQGAYSADQAIFVQAACVGEDSTPTLDLTCVPSKVFNIKDSFVGGNSFGDVFTETTPDLPTYASQGGSIVGATGTVTLTGLVNKTYTFEYTAQNVVACSPTHDDIGVLSVIHNPTPHVTIGTVTDNGNDTITVEFTYSGINSPFDVTLNSDVPSFQSGIVANNGNGIFTIYGVAGLNAIVLSAVTVCGTATNDTDVSITL